MSKNTQKEIKKKKKKKKDVGKKTSDEILQGILTQTDLKNINSNNALSLKNKIDDILEVLIKKLIQFEIFMDSLERIEKKKKKKQLIDNLYRKHKFKYFDENYKENFDRDYMMFFKK